MIFGAQPALVGPCQGVGGGQDMGVLSHYRLMRSVDPAQGVGGCEGAAWRMQQIQIRGTWHQTGARQVVAAGSTLVL